MIRNKRKTNKLVSALSAVIAVVMLGTTVFASGVLSDLATDDYTIEITNNGEKIELTNKPFIENGEVYLPLRETVEKAISEEEGLTDIKWNDGTINVVAAYYQGESGAYQFKIGGNYMKVKHINFKEFENASFNMDGVVISIGLRGTPLLLHSTTYVTIEDMNYMLYGFTNRRDANKNLIELTYHIYDKSGNDITVSVANASDAEKELMEMTNPTRTAELFFKAFYNQNFEKMKSYCTEHCINAYFGNSSVYGMKSVSLKSIGTSADSHEASEKFPLEISAYKIEFDNSSVFSKNRNSLSFYMLLHKQPNGTYLIDEFATGL